MNERIRELAEQAGLVGPSSRVGNSHEATEKFAELIVQECADVASGLSAPTVALRIKEHFGIKE
jgi:hypothetical protein